MTPCSRSRYHIIDLDDLRRAGKKASDYQGPKNVVRVLRPLAHTPVPAVAVDVLGDVTRSQS